MNKTKILGAMLLAMGMTGSAVAANGFYAGANIGQSDFDGCDGATSCDDTDTGWKIFGGWEMSENIAFEAGYADLGEISGTIGGLSGGVDVDGFGVGVKGTLPLNEQFGIFGKLGFIMWDADGTGSFSGFDDDGTDLSYGIGAQYMFTDQLGVTGEWERYDTDNEVDLLSIGVLIKF